MVDDLGMRATRSRARYWSLGLLAALCVAVALGIALGSVVLSPETLYTVLSGGGTGAQATIVWQVRLPRVLLGLVVGAGLGACGAALQAMVRNDLADPQLLGINAGASCGAALAILLGFGVGWMEHALQVMAFLGALAAGLVVYATARAGGALTALRLVLSGVAVGYALSALTSFLIMAVGNTEGTRSVMFWLLGSLGLAQGNSPLAVAVVVTLVVVALLTLNARQLDALAIGDTTAHAVGYSPHRLRAWLLVLVAACVGVLVAASGSIGFVGLVVPHLARRAVGSAHRYVVPISALMGAVLVVSADILARMVLSPREIPVGVITAMIGAPFLWSVIRKGSAAY
ncbi:FecCD family ABC transporter permease [Corynebacterium lowii]|uniref:Hemin transport system permease protein HmuU n=1 Tax=Corynebacterium lowii TaxID=1544413 RepID=A0A0Q1E3N5_9CORY|nr:iron ABC transporter permease [Corynebacterium lowii]KQB87320.1 Hemin transport system permease protein HmuU [Corynebacterium lowii]MDP9852092.1 iron complex transport system permease protein [Corynebacterium lowii]